MSLSHAPRLNVQLAPAVAVLTACILLLAPQLFGTPSSPDQAKKRILVLYWYGRDYPGNVSFEAGVKKAIREVGGPEFEYYAEYLETNRFPGDAQTEALKDYLRKKYSEYPIDVIIATPDPSVSFLLGSGEDLFPDTPIVFNVVKMPDVSEARERSGLTGIIQVRTHRQTVDLALRLQPQIKRVFVVIGSIEGGSALENVAREELRDHAERIEVTFLANLGRDELLDRVKSLPEDSMILYVWQQLIDESGSLIGAADTLKVIADNAKVPIYSMHGAYVGNGTIGGWVSTTEANADVVARVAVRIANGENAQDIPVVDSPTVPMFDWRELRRWNIPESALPPGSIIQFKQPTVWELYQRETIAVGVLLLMQSILIASLLIHKRRRSKAEQSLRGSEALNSAVLSSLQQRVAVLDKTGKIIAVNEGWKRSAIEQGLGSLETVGIGVNYLEICKICLADQEDETARDALAGITAVLNGELKEYVEEYQCNFPSGPRWFLLSVTPLDRIEGGAVVCHLDIEERKRAEAALRDSEKDVRASRDKIRTLVGQLMNLQDEERRRIAMELHDVTAQSLVALNMNLSHLGRLRSDIPDTRGVIDESKALCIQSLQEIRTLSYLLHPPMLDQLGLADAVKWYIDGFAKRSGIDVEFIVASDIGRLAENVETALFRVVQESLTNINRHSSSESAVIRLFKENGSVVLKVQDRGTPIVSDKEMGDGDLGVGIPGMRERMRQVNGNLTIDFHEYGTMLTATAPMENTHDAHIAG